MKCPKCGSEEIARYGKRVHFQCGSYGIGGEVDGSFYTSDHCAYIREIADLRTERDALQARVSELESEAEANAWKYNPAMAEAKMEQDAKRIDELQARVKRLEEAGDRMAETLNSEGWESVGQEMWNKAKESKP